jgi:hypothetical protein
MRTGLLEMPDMPDMDEVEDTMTVNDFAFICGAMFFQN